MPPPLNARHHLACPSDGLSGLSDKPVTSGTGATGKLGGRCRAWGGMTDRKVPHNPFQISQ